MGNTIEIEIDVLDEKGVEMLEEYFEVTNVSDNGNVLSVVVEGERKRIHAWLVLHDFDADAYPELDEDFNPEACPGCGCLPGEGLTKGCEDQMGCGRRVSPVTGKQLVGFLHDGTFIVDPLMSECGRFEETDPDAYWGPVWRETFPELAKEFDAARKSECEAIDANIY